MANSPTSRGSRQPPRTRPVPSASSREFRERPTPYSEGSWGTLCSVQFAFLSCTLYLLMSTDYPGFGLAPRLSSSSSVPTVCPLRRRQSRRDISQFHQIVEQSAQFYSPHLGLHRVIAIPSLKLAQNFKEQMIQILANISITTEIRGDVFKGHSYYPYRNEVLPFAQCSIHFNILALSTSHGMYTPTNKWEIVSSSPSLISS